MQSVQPWPEEAVQMPTEVRLQATRDSDRVIMRVSCTRAKPRVPVGSDDTQDLP